MKKLTNYRAGLETKFTFEKVNEDYSQNERFCTTKKNKQIFRINRKSILDSHLIGKGHVKIAKIC